MEQRTKTGIHSKFNQNALLRSHPLKFKMMNINDISSEKRKTWKGKMIKIMLKRRKESETYLAADRRHHQSTQIAMKVDKVFSFQPALRPSSAEEED